VRKNFPKTKIVSLKKNIGFASGNNMGFKQARGEYVVLLNNDAIIDKNWLAELVAAASDKTVGIVASKILLNTPFIEATITSSIVQQSDLDQSTDFSPRGVLIENITKSTFDHKNLIWYASGFEQSKIINGISLRWSTGKAKVLLPMLEGNNDFSFVFHGYPTSDNSLTLNAKITIADEEIFSVSLSPNSVLDKKITLQKALYSKECFWLIQNGGNVLLKNGYSKDIGGVTRVLGKMVEEFYEKDSHFFSKKRKLLAACGAGMLIKREVIEQVGFFNQHYFMYYEDIDFCLRAWKQGWDIVFAPKAIMRHRHRATTGKAESSFFVSMVEKNHLFLLLTHFPLRVFLREYILFILRMLEAVLRQFIFRFVRWNSYHVWKVKAAGRITAFLSFHEQLITFVKIRFWLQIREVRNFKEMSKHLY